MSPFTRPEIPKWYSSLVSAGVQNDLERLNKRKVSISSQISINSTTEEFIRAKEDKVSIDLEYVHILQAGLRDAYREGVLEKDIYEKAMKDIARGKRSRQEELIVHKRQKKILAEEIEEQLPRYISLEDAYTNVLVTKIMLANGKQKKSNFNQCRFRDAADEYYGGKKDKDGLEQGWCHALGMWMDHKNVKAAHLVAESLGSHDLAYLFGVGEAVLRDPANSLLLSSKIELSLDTGLIVLVPEKKGKEIYWKIILTKKDEAKKMVMSHPMVQWKDLDGHHLKFLGVERPAKRFLYFRFVITYLHAKKVGDMPWTAEVEAKGYMWATPGPYLRRSMLVTLARQVSDHYLPEVFHERLTFVEAEGSSKMSPEDEEIAALSLSMKIDSEKLHQEQRLINIEEGNYDDDDDGKDNDDD